MSDIAERLRLTKENESLRQQLETERVRLAACGVAALGHFNGCADEYKSGSLDDVLSLRQRVAELERDGSIWRNSALDLAEKLAACEKERDTALAALDAKIDICGDDRITELQEQLSAYQKERNGLRDLCALMQKSLEEDTARISELSDQLAAVEKERDEAANKALDYAAKYSDIVQAITDPENQPSQYGTVLLTQLAACEKERDELQAIFDHCKNTVVDLRAELAASQHYAQQLRDAMSEALCGLQQDYSSPDAAALSGCQINSEAVLSDALSLLCDTSALDGLRRDAERYRYLKGNGKAVSIDHYKDHYRAVDVVASLVLTDWVKSFDEAVDEAMKHE